ncbi:MAG: Ig-like domain repeat protein [Terracidiphilus sp.]
MFNHRYFSFAAAALTLMASISLCPAQESAQAPVKPEVREAWRKAMVRTPLPKSGCFKAEYPRTDWVQVECGRPSPFPNQRGAGGGANQVGNGADYAAQASGSNLISSSEGSFLQIAGGSYATGVNGDVAFTSTVDPNIFMLQMNSQAPFNATASAFPTPACAGAPNGAAGCYGWQQFLFSQTQGPAPGAGQLSAAPTAPRGNTPGVFIEYWLFNWGTPCPALPSWAVSGGTTIWTSDGAGDCWFNGPITYVPPQTAADLPNLVMTSSSSASQDVVELATTSPVGMYAYTEPTVLNLNQSWTQVEFNVFGDCCGTQTNFTSPTHLVVNTSIDDGTSNPPVCEVNDGTTGETNNLEFEPTGSPVCCPIGGSNPSIQFMEVWDTAHTHTAWCTPPSLEGDPHITTTDGTLYNFQGAGEFVSLRDSDGAEVQTRQKPVSTTFIGSDAYDGLTTCVSLNTAVAARVGDHRVTWEPNLSGIPDPSGLQLRIDGALTSLGPQGVLLGAGGRVAPQAGGALEVDFPDGKTLLVTPEWWPSQSEWYLNVDLSRLGLVSGDGAANGGGIAGALADGSWLPALPGGASVGAMPATLPARYDVLYKKFADAWRVNDKDTLFDYAQGTSTGSFTDRDWPPEQPPCVVPGSKPLEPGSEALAQAACRQVTDQHRRANCVFDVLATGDITFAKSYVATQRILAGSTTTSLTADANPTQIGEWVTFSATVVANSTGAKGVPSGSVQFAVDGSNVGEPVVVNRKGGAIWATSQLKVGTHKVTASYIPSAESLFLPSTSLEKLHIVKRCFCDAEREHKDHERE